MPFEIFFHFNLSSDKIRVLKIDNLLYFSRHLQVVCLFVCADGKGNLTMQVSICWDLAAHQWGLHLFNQDKPGIREGSYGQFNPNTT